MKISKVREEQGKEKLTVNARTAIVVNDVSQEGILYDDPARRERGRKTLEEGEKYIERRIRSARKLYSIFNEEKKKPGSKQTAKDVLIKAFSGRNKLSDMLKDQDSVLEKYAENSYANRKMHKDNADDYNRLPESVRRIINEEAFSARILSFVEENNKNDRYRVTITENAIDDAIRANLKNSLKREPFITAMKCFLMKTFSIQWNAPADINVQRDFIDEMLEDYYRVKTKGLVSESIRRKSMPVQPENIGSEKIFMAPVVKQSEKPEKTKSAEQQAFNRFLMEYANLDESVRNDKLKRIRRLVLLYFYGLDAAKSNVNDTEFDVWEDHAKHRDDKSQFVAIPKAEITGDKAKDKVEKEIRREKIKDGYRRKNIDCYRAAVAATESENNGLFFDDQMLNLFILHRIESGVERIYKSIKDDQDYKLITGYLSEKIWKDLLNYMSVRYIAVGKAVYNYAMKELDKQSDSLDMGHIDDVYLNGITSFDYELIKAEETLQREKAVYVAFASRHLAHQTVDLDKKNSDFLLLTDKEEKDDYIGKYVKTNVELKRAVLQFFGGKSIWRDFDFGKYLDDSSKDIGFLYLLKSIIYSMRNDSFHYTTMSHDNVKNTGLIPAMFEFETNRVAEILKNKFYSNNVPSYYSDKDLSELLTTLYKSNVERKSQVPSFNSVFVRKGFPEVIEKDMKMDLSAMSNDDKSKYYSAAYYMFKEIYYNEFLQCKDVRDRFVEVSTKVTKEYNRQKENEWRQKARELKRSGDKENAKKYEKLAQDYIAENDFGKKIHSIIYAYPDYDLAKICQLIMTEYNQQNMGNKKKKSSVAKEKNKNSYEHYKMLLLLNLRRCFEEFVKEAHPFILVPKTRDKGDEADFLADFKGRVKPYGELLKKLAGSTELQKWYVVGRLLSPKQANQFLGSLHSYTQYVGDVYRRAEEAGARISKSVNPEILANEKVSDIDAILDLCVKLSGTTSNELTDYFADKDEFAAYIGKYVDYEYTTGPYSAALQTFCETYADEDDKDWIFYDGKNPKMNRNILISKLYGEENIISEVFTRWEKADFAQYHKMKKEIAPFQNKGVYDTEDEQKAIKAFQEIKNHIELRDLVDYGEILDELQGQLVNWVYLRERDLMYFQLGFHYYCLNNDSEKPSLYKIINYKDITISNAVLYQICAIYTNGLPLYYISSKSGKMKDMSGSASTLIKTESFYKYTSGFNNNSDAEADNGYCYNAGLELFMNVKEEANIRFMRNDIEHFRFYTGSYNRSMLDLYGEVFDRFFTYDMKYRKNVPNLLYNILLQFFVNVKLQFVSDKKTVGTDEKAIEKACAAIRICESGGIVSEKFTYKLKSGKECPIAARNRKYLETVAKLMNYPHKIDPESIVKDLVVDKPFSGKKNFDKRRQDPEEKKIVEEYRKKKKEESKASQGNSFFSGIDLSSLPK